MSRSDIMQAVLASATAVAGLLLVFQGFLFSAYTRIEAAAHESVTAPLKRTLIITTVPIGLAVLAALGAFAWLLGIDVYWIVVGGFTASLISLLILAILAVFLKLLLRGFTAGDQLRALDRETQRELLLSINDATVVGNVYDLPPDTPAWDIDEIERRLGQMESAASAGIASIRAGRPVTPVDREAIAELVAAQIGRTTRAWNEMHVIADWSQKLWFEGISREGVIERYSEIEIEPTEEDIEAILDFSANLDEYRFVPPKGTFVLLFLQNFRTLHPYVAFNRNLVIVRSPCPFLLSDNPVTMIGHTVNGGLGVASAEEIWLPVERHLALVLTKDFSRPSQMALPARHTRRLSQRMALEANRWLLWHPNDDPIEGIVIPRPKPRLTIRTVGWRDRPDGTIGELVNIRPYRPKVQGERLLGGQPIVDRQEFVAAEWQARRTRRT